MRVVAVVGLSFYTFQAMSYLVDVYRGFDDRPSLGEFLLYMAFWPTVLSGPICRLPEMLPQLREAHRPRSSDVVEGTRRILCGLFMKVVVADTLANGLRPGEGVNAVFDGRVAAWGGLDVWFVAIGFGFYLFFDFAGYSHIAIGSARLLGIRLRENFRDPYLAQTPSEFWTRWHISLSSWIHDYVFFPLALSRPGLVWRNLALVMSMTLFGLWHGLKLTFVLWGVYHGLLLVAHRQVQSLRRTGVRAGGLLADRLGAIASWALSFGLISLGWVLFRANSPAQALTMLVAVFAPQTYAVLSLPANLYILVTLVGVSYFASRHIGTLLAHREGQPALARIVRILLPVSYAAAAVAIVIWSNRASTFVYFQF